jgi:hypothetical protein
MFCRFCGTTLPDDSTFCQSCGKSLATNSTSSGAAAAPALAPIQPPAPQPTANKKQNPIVARVLGLILVLLVIWWAVNKQDSSNTSAGFRPSTPSILQPQLHRVTIGSGALTVNASTYAYFTLNVPSGANNVRLQGRFSATGGSGNDIEVFLLSDSQYTNWQNGHSTPTFYNSGKVTVNDLNVVLPNDAGTYYLVFNNKFSLLSPKAVEERLSLTYYQ